MSIMGREAERVGGVSCCLVWAVIGIVFASLFGVSVGGQKGERGCSYFEAGVDQLVSELRKEGVEALSLEGKEAHRFYKVSPYPTFPVLASVVGGIRPSSPSSLLSYTEETFSLLDAYSDASFLSHLRIAGTIQAEKLGFRMSIPWFSVWNLFSVLDDVMALCRSSAPMGSESFLMNVSHGGERLAGSVFVEGGTNVPLIRSRDLDRPLFVPDRREGPKILCVGKGLGAILIGKWLHELGYHVTIVGKRGLFEEAVLSEIPISPLHRVEVCDFDVFVTNWSPRALSSLGLDFESLSSRCPSVGTFLYHTAYDSLHPFSQLKGYETDVYTALGMQASHLHVGIVDSITSHIGLSLLLSSLSTNSPRLLLTSLQGTAAFLVRNSLPSPSCKTHTLPPCKKDCKTLPSLLNL